MRANVVIKETSVVMLGVAVDVSANAGIIVPTAAGIGLEFVVEVAFDVKMLFIVWAGAIIGVVSGICTEVNSSGLAITLEFAWPSPLEELIRCC